jgi:hypothetical protein
MALFVKSVAGMTFNFTHRSDMGYMVTTYTKLVISHMHRVLSLDLYVSQFIISVLLGRYRFFFETCRYRI